MRPIVVAAIASLALHGAFLGRPPQIVPPPVSSGLVWVASPETFTGPRRAANRIFSGSSTKGIHSSSTGSAAPQWQSLGEVVAQGNTPPAYPPEALDRQWEGVVRLLVEFDESGGAAAVAVDSSSGHGILDEAAVQAARSWRLSAKGPKRSLIVPVSFQLSEEG